MPGTRQPGELDWVRYTTLELYQDCKGFGFRGTDTTFTKTLDDNLVGIDLLNAGRGLTSLHYAGNWARA